MIMMPKTEFPKPTRQWEHSTFFGRAILWMNSPNILFFPPSPVTFFYGDAKTGIHWKSSPEPRGVGVLQNNKKNLAQNIRLIIPNAAKDGLLST